MLRFSFFSYFYPLLTPLFLASLFSLQQEASAFAHYDVYPGNDFVIYLIPDDDRDQILILFPKTLLWENHKPWRSFDPWGDDAGRSFIEAIELYLETEETEYETSIERESTQTSTPPFSDPFNNARSAGATFSLRISHPQILSFSIGWVIGELDSELLEWNRSGFLIETDIGLGGGKASLGWLYQTGLLAFPVGMDIKGSFLRTWGMSWDRPPGENFVGLEMDIYLALVKASIGVFRKMPGQIKDAPPWMISGGLGIGY
jgi:hypothetical protein